MSIGRAETLALHPSPISRADPLGCEFAVARAFNVNARSQE